MQFELYFQEISYAKIPLASCLKTMESEKRHLPFIVPLKFNGIYKLIWLCVDSSTEWYAQQSTRQVGGLSHWSELFIYFFVHVSCNLNLTKIDKIAEKIKKRKTRETSLCKQKKNNKSDRWLKPPSCCVLRCAHHSDELPTHRVA